MPFKPGNKLGQGRPKKPEEIKALEILNREHVTTELSKILNMTEEQLKKALDQPHNSVLRIACLRLIKRVIDNGDYQCFDFLLNRTIGKVKDQLDLDLSVAARVQAHEEMIDKIPRDSLIELVKLNVGNAGE